MRYRDLNEGFDSWLASQLREKPSATTPTGIKDMGTTGDLRWTGPAPGMTDPGTGESWETWSVKQLPVIQETLRQDLEDAEGRLATARDELATMQDDIATVLLDLDFLEGETTNAVAEAAAALLAAQNAALEAATAAQTASDAADAAQTAQEAADAAADDVAALAMVEHVVFQGTPPPGRTGLLWFNTTNDQPYMWDGQWSVLEDDRVRQAAIDASAAQAAANAAQTAANSAQTAADNAAQAAADASQAAANAQDAADAAQTTASQALTSANGKNSRIVSLSPAPTSGAGTTTNPTTGLPLLEGDTWWQWDALATRVLKGTWVYRSGAWQSETLGDAVLSGLDVNKLLVLGTARMTEAVVGKIIGDAAYFNKLKVEDLTVTEDANIQLAVIQKLAARMIETETLRTVVDDNTGLYAIMDSFGFRVIDNDGPEGNPVELIKLGPDGEQLIQLGTGENLVSINSSGGITARTASVQDLWLDGHRLDARDLLGGPQGIVSQARMFPGKSRLLNGRGAVLGLEGTLRPGRVYKLESSSIIVDTEHATCDPFAQLHRTIDGTAPQANWGGSAVKESRVGPYSGFRTLPGMIHWIDLTHMDANGPDIPLRATLSLGNYAGNGWVQASAVVDVIWLVCEDWGPTFPNRGTPFYADGGSAGTPPPSRQTQKWTASGMATYQRGGGRDESGGSVQGQYSSWNRETLFVFPDMTATLSGAEIHRITCRSFFDTWYYSSGGTGSWCWHGETGIPASSPAKTFMVETSGWPRGAGREINIIPEEYAEWQSGIRRGFMFSTPVTSRTHYGRLSSDLNQHWIEVEYSK